VLYLIGGPARSGKSILAQRLMRHHQVPYFSADYLTTGLAGGAPELALAHELPNRVRGERIWPVLAPLLRNIVEVEPAYLVEGDLLLPERVAGLSAEYPGGIRTCFLGYARCQIESKCAAIRSISGGINDWVSGMSDEELIELVSEMKEFSGFLEAECARHGVQYFDGSTDFAAAVQEAHEYLLGAAEPAHAADKRDGGAPARAAARAFFESVSHDLPILALANNPISVPRRVLSRCPLRAEAGSHRRFGPRLWAADSADA
jgi:hypothetical protein